MDDENVLDSDELADEEYPEVNTWTPRRVHIPRVLVWGSLGLFFAAVIVLGVWGLTPSTWTYGMVAVDRATAARLAQIEAELRTVGAPQAALQHLSVAARPGINIGDAIEALVEADKALLPASDNLTIVAAQHNLRAILNDLHNRRYGYAEASKTPLPTLSLPH